MNPLIRSRPYLGTLVEVGVWDSLPDAPSAIDAGFRAIGRVHRLLSFHDPDSDLNRLNLADGRAVSLRPISLRVLRLAQQMTQASEGRFNAFVGGRLVREGALPNHYSPNATLIPAGNASDLDIEGGRARLLRPVAVTLDGIAKGFAVDLGVQALRRRGITSGWINAGGDIRVFGRHFLPLYQRTADGSLCPLGELRNSAIATSRTSAPDDRFRARIVAGEVTEPEKGVWTVIAPEAWRADALTKVAANADTSIRESLIKTLGGRLVASPILA